MHRRLSQVMTALKEHWSVGYAKIVTMGGFGNIYCIITKATPPDDSPVSDRYINQLLKLFTVSPSSSSRSFSLGLSRRFMETRSWRVALKCLILLHRLIQILPEIGRLRDEIIWARTKGLLCLNPCMFVDSYSSSYPEDYDSFIRSYASLLDETIDYYSNYTEEMEERDEHEEANTTQETLAEKMEEFAPKPDTLTELLPQLQSLMDRVLACQPTPIAIQNNLVQSSLTLIISDSFVCYLCFRKQLVNVLESLLNLPYSSRTFAFNIYKKAAVQTNQLSAFYNWCKYMDIFCEYPFIDKIPEFQVIALQKLVTNMWELTESSSPSSMSPLMGSRWSAIEDGREKNVTNAKTIISSVWEKFEDDLQVTEVAKVDKMGPLIQFNEVEENIEWDLILDASIGPSFKGTRDSHKYIYNSQKNSAEKYMKETNEWQIEVYNPNLGPNPVYHGQNVCQNHKTSSTNLVYPWGL